MATASDINTAIGTQATKAASTTVGNHSATRRSIQELIAAENHLANQEAGASRGLPLRLIKLRPGGCG